MQTVRAEQHNIEALRALFGLRSELEFVEAFRLYLHEHMDTHLHVDWLGGYQDGPNDSPLWVSHPQGDLLDIKGMFFLAEVRNHGDDYLTLWGITRSGDWIAIRVYYKNHPKPYTPTRISASSIDSKALLEIATVSEVVSAFCDKINGIHDYREPVESVVDKREVSLKRAVGLAGSLSLMKRLAKEKIPSRTEG